MSFMLWIAVVVGFLLMSASAVKWSLPINRSFWIIVVATLAGLSAGIYLSPTLPLWFGVLVVLGIEFLTYVGQIAYLFYRDPERNPPADENAIVSPADGKVIYIKELAKGEFLQGTKKGKKSFFDELNETKLSEHELYQIGIALMFTDVHINRSPIGGTIKLLKHQPGKFFSLRVPEAADVNERNSVLIENPKIMIGLVQIASRLVRRIDSFVTEGQNIEIGTRIGIIKFGSQIDVFIPKNKVEALEIKKGQYLYAGETILCRILNHE